MKMKITSHVLINFFTYIVRGVYFMEMKITLEVSHSSISLLLYSFPNVHFLILGFFYSTKQSLKILLTL